VGVALVIASVVLVAGLRRSLTDDIRTSARLRAEDVAAALEADEEVQAFAVDDAEEMFVQVVGADGRVVASTQNVAGEPPLADLAADDSTTVSGLRIESGDFVVVSEGAETGSGDVTVMVGRSLELVEDSTDAVTNILLVAVPLLLLVVGGATWWLTGRALSPVEAIGAEVEQITGSDLSRRVPVPASGDEIARLAETMNSMLGRVQAARDRQLRFVSDASHELRSPVASIRQQAEVALARPEQTGTGQLARSVLAEDERMQALVDNLLWLARADEGALRLQTRPLDLDDLVLEEGARLRALSGLTIDSSGVGGGRVAGDGTALRQLLRNLTDNAARHARTRIALSVGEDGADGVLLAVEDDGAGIAEADRERIFERFERLDGARARDAGGSGLGLAIASEIVKAHGGSIRATEGRLGGARFEVRLPLMPD
jgi:signal transduction histidine kinase